LPRTRLQQFDQFVDNRDDARWQRRTEEAGLHSYMTALLPRTEIADDAVTFDPHEARSGSSA
jgi:hypothetical protein